MDHKDKSSRYVVFKTFTTRVEAEIHKGYLEAHSIKSQVTADDEGGGAPFPFQPSNTGVKLLIQFQDLDLAKKLTQNKSQPKTAPVNKPLLIIVVLVLLFFLYLFTKDL